MIGCRRFCSHCLILSLATMPMLVTDGLSGLLTTRESLLAGDVGTERGGLLFLFSLEALCCCCKRIREGSNEQKDEGDGGAAISQLIRYLPGCERAGL